MITDNFNIFRATQCCLLLFVGVSVLPVSESALAQVDGAVGNRSLLNINVGVSGIESRISSVHRYGMEFGFKNRFKWNTRPATGFVTAGDDCNYLYAGLRRDFYLRDHLALTAGFDIGFLHNGEQLRLGNELEFRTLVDLSYVFANDWRATIGIHHISNAGLGNTNPGTNDVVLSVSLPVASN